MTQLLTSSPPQLLAELDVPPHLLAQLVSQRPVRVPHSCAPPQVHPSVPGIIFTPICPHSLSFRPLVFPDHVQLRVQVPESVRNTEMRCSFDGSHHIALRAGDALVVQMSQHPVPTVCDVNVSHDWFCSVREGLYWNLRKMQGAAEGKQQGGAE